MTVANYFFSRKIYLIVILGEISYSFVAINLLTFVFSTTAPVVIDIVYYSPIKLMLHIIIISYTCVCIYIATYMIEWKLVADE
jgi:hypothetical protein